MLEECSRTTAATFTPQSQLLTLQKLPLFVRLLRRFSLLLPLCCSFSLISFLSFPKQKEKRKRKRRALIISTWHRAQAAISACYISVRDSSLLLLYFPKQRRICLSHRPRTEYCRALQFHALATDKSFCSAGHESSRAEWPHSVALLHLTLERLHPLKPGMHLRCFGKSLFYFHTVEEQVRC